MAEKHSVDERVVFQIEMQGKLDDRWSDWFNGLTVVVEGESPPITTLIGPTDQAGLRGILNRIWDLNLRLISVVPIETHVQSGGNGR